MSRTSRALTVLYLLTFIWGVCSTINSWGQVPTWDSLLTAATSVVLLIAIAEQYELADALREAAALCEREGQRAAWDDEQAEALAADELDDACCEHWWTSFGTDHDDTCPHQTPRSNAA
ncbi:hypothetical protein OHA71_06575 [Streptomyces sp. NBC_00444]|uniref:hypothetical protein n=1 Tax=Streptomyces sp. NBC_00444 TaxID=2975744 RepID=UPI002E1FDE6E